MMSAFVRCAVQHINEDISFSRKPALR